MKDSDKPSMSDFPLGAQGTEAWQEATTQENLKGGASRPRGRGARAWGYTKWTFLAVCCLFTMTAGAVFGNFYLRSPAFQRFINRLSPKDLIATRDITGQWTPQIQFPKEHVINVLIMGCDVDYDERKPVQLKNSRGRSDSLMIAHLDFDNQTISVLSIPRDTAVTIPEHGRHKINAAHAYGGPELTQRTIRDTFGINTDYYVGLNYDAFQKVVDSIGGVEVTVLTKMDYDDNWGQLHIHLNPGRQLLNGTDAMGYVRFRHTDSDIARAERQHEFLQALKDKATSRQSFMKLPDMLNVLSDNIESNMSQDQMLALANFARRLPKEKVQLETLPALEAKNFVYLDPVKSEEVIRRMFFNNTSRVVNVNILSRTSVTGMSQSERRKKLRHAGHTNEESVPRDDNGDPLDSGDDSSNSSPASRSTTHSAPPPNDSKPDKSEGADPPKSKPDDNKGDGDKPGSGKSGGEGKDNGAKPAPGGETMS